MEISTVLKEACDDCHTSNCEGCGIDWAKHKLPKSGCEEHLLPLEKNPENYNLLWQICYGCNDLDNCPYCVMFRTKVAMAVWEERNNRAHNNMGDASSSPSIP